MSALTDYLENKLTDHLFRGTAYLAPSGIYVALFKCTAGQSPRSTAVTSGQTTVPATPNGRMYRCTTGGTTGAGEPTWPTTNGGTVTDGTAVWTEMNADFEGNTANLTEVSGGAYARQNLAPSTANWAATNAPGSTAATSTGTSGTTSNNAAISYPAATANWGFCSHVGIFDALTTGNMLWWGQLATPQAVNNGNTFSFAAGTLQAQIDN
jgi:hypothetical protein